jgi:Zn-dependent protease with chaperone function
MSLAIRAAFAIGLMVLFYALAIAMCTALVLVGLRLLHVALNHNEIDIIASNLCFLVAGWIAWSALPRLDRFKAPGPEVVEGEHPRLFAEILAVATATGQRMPDHVYLIPEVNAFVAQRGGIMGIGSRRVMGIGLPLLRTLQIDELRAVLAHEMGHFSGGDTRLGPWIYTTRSGLARMVANLAKLRQWTDHSIEQRLTDHSIGPRVTALRIGLIELIGWPTIYRWIEQVFTGLPVLFRWFLIGFMRVSQAISRAQEYSADAVAVRAEGWRAFVDGLKKTHAASIAHAIYMRTEVLPLVKQGALPAVGEGFSRFLLNDRFTKLLDEAVTEEMTDGTADPYDSHPPLRTRIAVATALRGPDKPPDPRRAIELVEDAGRIESNELGSHVHRKLEPVSWNDTDKWWIALWREEVEQAKRLLVEIRIDAIPSDYRHIYRITTRLLGQREADALSDEGLGHWWISTISAALAVMLLDAGFAVTIRLGEPFRFTRGDATVEPVVELRQLIAGEISEDAWCARWTKLGFANRNLAINAAGRHSASTPC